jgi:HTH-type transcriptional regulator / antitoxin HipB
MGARSGKSMSDLKRYVDKRIAEDTEFADGFEVGYANFRIGVLLRQAREAAGMTQEEVAQQLRTTKSAISRIENHAEDIRLSTLNRYAKAVGAKLQIRLGRGA